jgi:rod shape-determining protein MreD
MDAIFLSLLTIFLIICQSVIFPFFSFFRQSFDILLIIVLLISITSERRSVIFAIIAIGLIMDSISGVSFFLNTFSYLLVYMLIVLFKNVIFKQSVVFIMLISFIAVIIQNGLIVFSIFIKCGTEALYTLDYSLIIKQAFWAVIIISPAVFCFQKCRNIWKLMTEKIRNED